MINKNIKNENKYFDIKEKKDKFIDLNINPDKEINKIIIKTNHIFILMKNELIIVGLNEDLKILKTIELEENYLIYKVLILSNYLHIVTNISIIKYYIKDDFKKLEEFKWKYKNEIYKIKQFNNYLILRCKDLLLIIDLYNFEELLNLKDNIYENDNYSSIPIFIKFNILVFKNYLVYFKTENIINIFNWNNDFKIEKEFNISVIFNNSDIETYLYKSYIIFINSQYEISNIIDLNNNYKNITINNMSGLSCNYFFKKINNLLFIINEDLIIIYNMTSFETILNIRVDYEINKVVNIRNLLITYNNKINDFIVLDYKKNIFNLNIIKKKNLNIMYKSYKNNLIYIEKNILKNKEIKTNLNMISEGDKYDFEYKNYCIKMYNDNMVITNINEYKIVYNEWIDKYLVYNNYIVSYKDNKLTVINLDNLDDIREKIYEFYIDKICKYEDKLYIYY